MTHGLYLVTGTRAYRGHEPGTRFEALLDPNAERRAVRRGDIRLLERIVPALPPDYELPAGWAATATTEAPKGASLIEGGG